MLFRSQIQLMYDWTRNQQKCILEANNIAYQTVIQTTDRQLQFYKEEADKIIGPVLEDLKDKKNKKNDKINFGTKSFPVLDLHTPDAELLEVFLEWKQICDHLVSSSDYVERTSVQRVISAILSCQTGDARRLLNRLDYTECDSMEKFFKKISESLILEDQIERGAMLFQACRQKPNEDIRIFASRLKNYYVYSLPDAEKQFVDRTIIKQFLDGLYDKIGRAHV